MKMKTKTIKYLNSKHKDPADIIQYDKKEWEKLINNAKKHEQRNRDV